MPVWRAAKKVTVERDVELYHCAPDTMKAALANPTARRAILLFSLIVFSIITYTSGWAWHADNLASSTDPADWLRAAKAEPSNANYWFKIGFNRQWDINNSDVTEAISYFRRAVEIDPRSATFWTELAGAYETAGRLPEARQAYQTALACYPTSPDTHWRYGNFLLRQGESTQAYAEIHEALEIDPSLIPLAISRIWRATQDLNALLKDVLPDSEEAQEQALEVFCGDNDLDQAIAVWKHLSAAGRAIPINAAFPLEDLLVKAGRADDARAVWRQALIASGNSAEAQANGELVFNGGFEFDSANGGLDWRQDAIVGAIYDYDTTSPHSGKRALRVRFDGTQNIGFFGVWQIIPASPGAHYHFQGYLRTTGITTQSGMRFLILFDGSGQPPLMLGNLTGDNPWQAQESDFVVPAGTYALRVGLYRELSQRFNNKLAGTVWVDDVSIMPGVPGHPNP